MGFGLAGICRRPTVLRGVGHFEENKFSVGGHQYCPQLIITYNFGQNAVNKSQFKNKMNNIGQLSCLFSKLPRLFVNFPSLIVVIFYRDTSRCYLAEKSYVTQRFALF